MIEVTKVIRRKMGLNRQERGRYRIYEGIKAIDDDVLAFWRGKSQRGKLPRSHDADEFGDVVSRRGDQYPNPEIPLTIVWKTLGL